MRIAMGSDRAGLALKEAEKVFLTAQHRDILDHDTHSADPLDYSDYAEAMGLVGPKKAWRSPSRNHSISPERYT